MARFYSNENIGPQVVAELRRLGNDVLTSLDAGKANAAVPDAEVLSFAVAEVRILFRTTAATLCIFIGTGLKTTLGSSFAQLTRTSADWRSESTWPSQLRLTSGTN